jgi:hypothetical protein
VDGDRGVAALLLRIITEDFYDKDTLVVFLVPLREFLNAMKVEALATVVGELSRVQLCTRHRFASGGQNRGSGDARMLCGGSGGPRP